MTGRLSALVDQILDVTHLQADPLILERAPVAVRVARRRGCAATSRPAGRADRLVVDLPDDLPPLDVDGARVGQVLENLVGNAFKYGPPDGARDRSAPRSTGSGWPSPSTTRASASPRRNGRSSRNRSIAPGTSASRASPGTGLGLFICRRLVEAHGGRLRLEDRPDGRAGTRVTFTLPLLRGRAPAAAVDDGPLGREAVDRG